MAARFYKASRRSQQVTAGSPATAGPWYFDTSEVSSWSAIAEWGGTLGGTFKVEAGSNFEGYDRIAQVPGTWVDVTAAASPAITNPAGAPGNTEIAANFWTAAWVRISLASATGTGLLTLDFTGKE